MEIKFPHISFSRFHDCPAGDFLSRIIETIKAQIKSEEALEIVTVGKILKALLLRKLCSDESLKNFLKVLIVID
jgi:hypothetical protein